MKNKRINHYSTAYGKKNKHKGLTHIFAILLVAVLCIIPIEAEAAKLPVNTLLDHPDFGDTSYCPDNRFYDTDNIHAAIWSYGYECNTLNLNGIDEVVDEVLNKVSKAKNPLKYKNRWFSLWTQGDDMSKQNLDDLYNAGWNILGLTYYDYWVETVLQPIDTAYYEPRFAVVDDEGVKSVLVAAGHNLEKYPVGMITVSGVSMPCRSCVFYCPDFTFLSKKTVYGYKFYSEANRFVKLEEVRYNGYKKKFLDIYYGKKGKEGNGLFVFTTVELPGELVVSEEEITSIIAEIPPQSSEEPKTEVIEDKEKNDATADNSQLGEGTSTDEKQSEEQGVEPSNQTDISVDNNGAGTDTTDDATSIKVPDATSTDILPGESAADGWINVESDDGKTIAQWCFKNGNIPSEFRKNVSIRWTGKQEVTADFDYSGSLPAGTTVTLFLPFEDNGFKDGEILYLYYCNPDTGMRELAGTGIYFEGSVTFEMAHCSEYLIINENRGDTFLINKANPAVGLILGGIGIGVIAIIVVLVLLRKKKK